MARELPDDTALPRRSTPDPARFTPLPVIFAVCSAVCVATAVTASTPAVALPCGLAALGHTLAAYTTRPRSDHR